MDAKSWIKRVANEPPATVAKKLGITPSTLDSQMKSANGLKPEVVVQIARAYKADVVASLVELGLITAEDVGAEVDLSEADHLAWLQDEERAPDDLLLAEIGRRIASRRQVDFVWGANVEIVPDKPSKPRSGKKAPQRPPLYSFDEDAEAARDEDGEKPKLSDDQ